MRMHNFCSYEEFTKFTKYSPLRLYIVAAYGLSKSFNLVIPPQNVVLWGILFSACP